MSSVDQFCLNFSKMTTFLPQLGNQQPSMPSLKPHAQAHLLSPTDKCKICAEPAARHVHYGATTCFSCRAFFRRSLQNKTSAKYVCRKEGICEMNLKTRKNCQYCRYMKCLVIGMNPGYVLSKDELQRRFKKRYKSENQEETKEEPDTLVTVPSSTNVNSFVNNKADKKEANAVCEGFEKQPKDTYVKTIPFSKEQQVVNQYFNEYNRKYVTPIKQYFEQNNMNQKPTIFQTECPPFIGNQSQLRESIIIRNGGNPYTRDLTDVVNSFENKIPVIKETTLNINIKEEKPETPQNEDIKPLVGFSTFKPFNTFETTLVLPIKKRAIIDMETKLEYDSDKNSKSEDEMPLISLSNEPELMFSEDERHQLDQLVNDHDTVYHSVNFGEVLIKEMLMCSMFGVAMSTSAAIQGYRLQVERITRIANSLKCFTILHKKDQVVLLKENADLLVSLQGAMFFDKRKKGVDQVFSSMGIDDTDIIKNMFKPLIQNHSMNHIDYEVFNSIQDPGNKKTEERYSFLQEKVADAILDNVTTILITYVILFSSDFCSLADRSIVEKTQNHYLRILHRLIYSSSSRNKACNRLANTINAVTCVREMADIKKNRNINPSATSQIQT